MENPLVTVFIPVFNCENYIRDSLESIINQSYTNIEILIIDDGSSDQTISIINSYQDSRIRLLVNEENKGIPYTRQRGLNECRGKYMAIMDADDIAFSNRVERQVDYMEKNSDIGAIGSYYQVFGGKLNRSVKPKAITPEEIKAGLVFYSQIGNPTALVRLDLLKEKNIGYNLQYFVSQDYDMWVQISKVAKIAIIPEVLLKYRTGHANITNNSISTKALARKKVIDSIHEDILNFYQFQLTPFQLKVFNDFYNEHPKESLSEEILAELPTVMKQIATYNRKNKTINDKIFTIVMHKSLIVMLTGHDLNLKRKLQLYNQIRMVTNFKKYTGDSMYIIAKHLYRKLR